MQSITIYTNRVFRIVVLVVNATSRYEVNLWTYAICANALHTSPFRLTGIVSASDPVYMGNVMFYGCRVFSNSVEQFLLSFLGDIETQNKRWKWLRNILLMSRTQTVKINTSISLNFLKHFRIKTAADKRVAMVRFSFW